MIGEWKRTWNNLRYFLWRSSPQWVRASLSKFHDHTQTHHIRQDSSGRVISPSQRPLPDNTRHSQKIFMPPVGFEPAVPTSERPKTHALDRAASGISFEILYIHPVCMCVCVCVCVGVCACVCVYMPITHIWERLLLCMSSNYFSIWMLGLC
jgi:hypothetical protein